MRLGSSEYEACEVAGARDVLESGGAFFGGSGPGGELDGCVDEESDLIDGDGSEGAFAHGAGEVSDDGVHAVEGVWVDGGENGVGEGEAGDFEAVPRGIDVLAGDEDVAAGGIGRERGIVTGKEANGVNKNIQIRGIVSNIAYAIKYGRNVEELIDLYNQNPVNYVVYLINPINDKKLAMLYNRIRNEMIYDNDAISKELTYASNTWKDYEYFEKAVETLKAKYKGKLEIIESKTNDYDEFADRIKLFEIYDIPEDFENPGIKV